MKRFDASLRNDSTASGADLNTGTMKLAACFKDFPVLKATSQHARISAPVQPSHSGKSWPLSKSKRLIQIGQILACSALVGRSTKNVPSVKRRRNSGGREEILLHVAI